MGLRLGYGGSVMRAWYIGAVTASVALTMLGCGSGSGPAQHEEVAIGAQGVLYDPNAAPSRLFGITIDREAFDELHKAQRAGDQTGITNLFLSGRVFGVGQNVRVLVIDRSDYFSVPIVRVRVLGGKHAGKDGWTAAEWVRVDSRQQSMGR